MRPTIRLINLGIIMLLIFMVFGCSSFDVKSNTVEEISPTILLYLDRDKNGKLQMSTLIPPLKKERKSLITIHAGLMKEGRSLMDHKYYREMKSGQLRILAVSERLARNGIMDVINTMLLDPEISDRVYLAVVQGDMRNYLKNQLLQEQEQIDFYLYNMLSHYEKQKELTIANLHQFMESLYDPYADPIIPFFSVSKDEIVYQGTALFKDEVMKGVIHPPDDVFFQILSRKTSLQKTIPLPALDTTLGEVHSTRRIRFNDSFRKAQIEVQLRGRVEEHRGNRDFNDPSEAASWIRRMERQIEAEMERLIHRFQSLSVDPIPIGKHTLSLMRRPFGEEQWKKHWPHMQVNVRVHVNLEHGGMLKPNKSRFAP